LAGLFKFLFIQAFFVQPVLHQVCNLYVVKVAEGEVRVAGNAYFRQVYNGAVAAVAVNGCRKFMRHIQADAPGIFIPLVGVVFGNVVAVVNDDRDFGQLHKFVKRYGFRL
jgi:ABC-type enterochelin transport system permease subunit